MRLTSPDDILYFPFFQQELKKEPLTLDASVKAYSRMTSANDLILSQWGVELRFCDN